MKRVVFQACVFFGLLLAVKLISLPYGSYREKAVTAVRTHGSKAGIMSFDAEAIDLSFPAILDAKKINAIFALQGGGPLPIPLPLLIDELSAKLGITSLFTLRPNVNADIRLYSGVVKSLIRYALLGKTFSLESTGSEIELAQHPFLASIGLAGKIGFRLNIDGKRTGAINPEHGNLDLSIEDGKLNSGLKLFQIFAVPAVEHFRLSLKALLDGKKLSLTKTIFESSLGNINASGGADLDALLRPEKFSLSGSIELTALGKKQIGPYLALASNGKGNAETTNWAIDLEWAPRTQARINLQAVS